MSAVGILAFGSLIRDPGDELRPLIVRRIKTTTPFPVEYGRYSKGTRGGAPTLVPHPRGSGVAAEILVLKDSVPVEHAVNMLWRRETRTTDPSRGYPAGTEPNSVQVRRLPKLEDIETVLYTDFPDAGKEASPTADELAEAAIVSAAAEVKRRVKDEARTGQDGITYLAQAMATGIRTPLTESYCTAILQRCRAATLAEALEKVRSHEGDRIALALSGGGMRAALFHLGVFARLVSADRLKDVSEIVAVSGGSILAGHFGRHWHDAVKGRVEFVEVAADFLRIVRSDLRHQIFRPWVWTWYWPGKPGLTARLQAAYDKYFGGDKLRVLPKDGPLIAYVATGYDPLERVVFTREKVLRFRVESKAAADEQLKAFTTEPSAAGTPIALAVAASSCFPPVFPKLRLDHRGLGLTYDEFGETLRINDGGVIDNLGLGVLRTLRELESLSCNSVLVCDAERGQFEKPRESLGNLVEAMASIISSLARTDVKQAFQIRCGFAFFNKRIPDSVLSHEVQTALAGYRTDLDSPPWQEIHALLLQGYMAAWQLSESYPPLTEEDAAEARDLVQAILIAADCGGALPLPTEADLNGCSRLPLRRIGPHLLGSGVLHLAALVVVVLLICSLFSKCQKPQPSPKPGPPTVPTPAPATPILGGAVPTAPISLRNEKFTQVTDPKVEFLSPLPFDGDTRFARAVQFEFTIPPWSQPSVRLLACRFIYKDDARKDALTKGGLGKAAGSGSFQKVAITLRPGLNLSCRSKWYVDGEGSTPYDGEIAIGVVRPGWHAFNLMPPEPPIYVRQGDGEVISGQITMQENGVCEFYIEVEVGEYGSTTLLHTRTYTLVH
jgi:predicted acylesterase/phospholipase RssA